MLLCLQRRLFGLPSLHSAVDTVVERRWCPFFVFSTVKVASSSVVVSEDGIRRMHASHDPDRGSGGIVRFCPACPTLERGHERPV